jgi:hypothetical protein
MIIRDRKPIPAKVSSAIQQGFALLGAAIVGALVAGMITFGISDAHSRETEQSWMKAWSCSEEKRSLEGIEADLRDEVAYAAAPKEKPVASAETPYPYPDDPSQPPRSNPVPVPGWMTRTQLDDYELTIGLVTDSRVLINYVATTRRLQSYCGAIADESANEAAVWGATKIADLSESKLQEFATVASRVRQS